MLEITTTPLVIMAILAVVAVSLPLAGMRRPNLHQTYAAVSLAALVISMGYVGYQFVSGVLEPGMVFGTDVLADDMFGGIFAIAMLLVAVFSVAGSASYMKNQRYPAVYYSLILMSAIGMVLVAYSTDLVMLFVAWELMSIPTYVLAGFMKKNPMSNEAALKYFLFGAMSSAIIIYGISLAYGLTGSTNIAEVISGMATLDATMMPLAVLAAGLFIAGFGFKMGLVPFHMWLPDAYEGAPQPITALLAAATKKAGFAAAIRVVIMGMAALHLDWALALGVIAIMTMTIGNVAAIMQKNLSRMLAYSSIGHAGYILIGLAVAPYTAAGLQGSIYHVFNHAVMKGAAFIAISGVVAALAVTHIEKLKGLGRRMPITAMGITISFLALAGVPPLNGFWSKLVLFGAALDAEVWWGPWLAIAGVLNSALSLAYYGWVIRKMYFEDVGMRPAEQQDGHTGTIQRVREPRAVLGVMIFSILFMVGLGVYPDPVIQLVEMATPAFVAP